MARRNLVRETTLLGHVPALGDLPPVGNGEDLAVGIDPSLTGYAVTAYSPSLGKYRSWLFKPKNRGARRLRDIRSFVLDVLAELELNGNYVIQEVCLEGYSFGSANRAHTMGECGGVTRLALLEYFRDRPQAFPVIVAPTALKKFVTGSGKGQKDQMLLSVFKHWEVEFNDHNQADSYGLARVGAAMFCGDGLDTKYRQEVLKKVRRDS